MPMATRLDQRPPVGGALRATSTTAMPPVRPKGSQQSGGMGRGPLIGIAAAIVIAVIVGVIVVTNRGSNNAAGGTDGTGGSPGGGTQTTSSAPAATPINRQPLSGDPGPNEQTQTVTDFFAQLPGNAHNAVSAYFLPAFQGGPDSFLAEMGNAKTVTLSDVQPGNYYIRATEHIVAKDGTRTSQAIGVGLKWQDAQLYIQKIEKIGAVKPES
jgi:hypothetical protein